MHTTEVLQYPAKSMHDTQGVGYMTIDNLLVSFNMIGYC